MPVRITQADLRQAMRDARYWKPGHSERAAYSAWVTDGFRALNPPDAAPRNAVWVKAYTRDGHVVAAHWRASPPRQATAGATSDQSSAMRPPGVSADIVEVGALSRILRRLRRGPADGRGSGGGTSSAPGRGRHPRRPDGEGRDLVDDLRSQPDTRRMDNLRDRVDQWDRPGGEAGRARDLESLRPDGPPTNTPDGRQIYRLQDGRTAVARPSTSPGSDGMPTLEIAEPTARAGRFQATDKFRYPPVR
ncbi:hypothetical protein ROS9278_03339 [Roseomonas sp. CECT 9278]|nr:hypothetical protein ROS9278_03339 [Roseomonas sp. CECT 9278]